MKKTLVILPLVLAMTACSSMKYETGLEFKAPEFGGGDQQDEVAYPGWYTDTPKKDDQALYAVASEYSKDFQFSVDKAMLSAKRELASNFSSHIDGMMKDFGAEIGDVDSSVVNDINRTTKLVISRVNLVGVQRVNFKVVHEKAGYRSFVRLRYATDESNRLLLNEIKRNRKLSAKLEASKSFKELEESVNKIEKPN
jgi:hypothetical protein